MIASSSTSHPIQGGGHARSSECTPHTRDAGEHLPKALHVQREHAREVLTHYTESARAPRWTDCRSTEGVDKDQARVNRFVERSRAGWTPLHRVHLLDAVSNRQSAFVVGRRGSEVASDQASGSAMSTRRSSKLYCTGAPRKSRRTPGQNFVPTTRAPGRLHRPAREVASSLCRTASVRSPTRLGRFAVTENEVDAAVGDDVLNSRVRRRTPVVFQKRSARSSRSGAGGACSM